MFKVQTRKKGNNFSLEQGKIKVEKMTSNDNWLVLMRYLVILSRIE